MAPPFRLLFVSDTHLGFDDPQQPRVERRRRGPDFLANLERALLPALRGEVDAVLHGGDLFHRSEPPLALVERGFQCLTRVAEAGVPVFVVPGNHERSKLPFPLLALHRNVFVFDKPRTFTLPGGIALSGFPYAHDVRARFRGLFAETGHAQQPASLRLLCVHQAVEGARVGTPEFVFRDGDDVIRGRDLPEGFAAVLSGHIHRGQRLCRGLDGRPFPAPFFYPGSVERTSFAERHEKKGYLILRFSEGLVKHDFYELPTRPLVRLQLESGLSDAALRARFAALPEDAVVRVELSGPGLAAERLRALAPREMTLELAFSRERANDGGTARIRTGE